MLFMSEFKKMRINQYIAHNGRCSRRQADELIKQGLVKINKRVASLSDKVSAKDKVFIKSRLISPRKKFSVIIYNKPKGELVSHKDERGRRIIFESLPHEFRNWRFVGRLDYASEGLLLLTDSAVIADALSKSDLEREYYLKIKGKFDEKVLESLKEAMKNGLEITDKKGAHKLSKITKLVIAPFLNYEFFGSSGGYTKLRVLINEGKNRELRRFFAQFDLEVVELKRVAFGALDLGTLKQGKFRYLSSGEYDKLRDFLKLNEIRY